MVAMAPHGGLHILQCCVYYGNSALGGAASPMFFHLGFARDCYSVISCSLYVASVIADHLSN